MDTVLSADTTATVDSNLTEADRAPFVLEDRYRNVLRPPPPIPGLERTSSYIESDSEEGVILRRMGLEVNILSGVSDATKLELSSIFDETMVCSSSTSI